MFFSGAPVLDFSRDTAGNGRARPDFTVECFPWSQFLGVEKLFGVRPGDRSGLSLQVVFLV
jgi:hypothetical protein